MNYESEDVIGGELGDIKGLIAKAKKGAKKLKAFVRKVRGKAKGVRVTMPGGGSVAVDESGQVVLDRPGEVGPGPGPGPGGGVMEFVRRNPLIVGGGALVALLLLTRRR